VSSTTLRLAVCLFALAAAGATAPPLRPDDFATGRTIESDRDDPLQSLLVDLLVYRGSVGPGLADLRVFNAQGEEVPHAIRALATPERQPMDSVVVPWFLLPEAAGGAASGAGLARSHGVEVEVGADGAIVRVEPLFAGEARPPSTATPRPANTVLLDLTQAPRDVVALELDLGPEPAEFVVPLRVEVGDDLVHFRARRTRSALARLEQGGHRIERSDVSFVRTGERYLLLTADGAPLPVEIRGVRARLAPTEAPPPRQETELLGVALADEPGAHLFDVGGAVPIDRVQVALPQRNSVVRAELSSAARPEGPWTRHHQGLLYRIERKSPLRNDAIDVRITRHRYFKLVVAPEGGGLGGDAPRLEVSWHPEQLLFVQRGPGPFALGYGRSDTEPARFSASELLRTVGAPPGEVPRATAALASPRPVGDPSVLEPRPAPPPERPYGLWAFLVAAVAVVVGQSVRLLRQMRARGDGPT
jgi:hypothetical protein